MAPRSRRAAGQLTPHHRSTSGGFAMYRSWRSRATCCRDGSPAARDAAGLRSVPHHPRHRPPGLSGPQRRPHAASARDLRLRAGRRPGSIDVQLGQRPARHLGRRKAALACRKRSTVHINERFAGKFHRALTLPDDADPEEVDALQDGVLRITGRRRAAAQPRAASRSTDRGGPTAERHPDRSQARRRPARPKPNPRVTRGPAPPVDVIEDAQGITLYADLPGVSRDKLQLEVEAGTLAIKARCTWRLPEGSVSHSEVAAPRSGASRLGKGLDTEENGYRTGAGRADAAHPQSHARTGTAHRHPRQLEASGRRARAAAWCFGHRALLGVLDGARPQPRPARRRRLQTPCPGTPIQPRYARASAPRPGGRHAGEGADEQHRVEAARRRGRCCRRWSGARSAPPAVEVEADRAHHQRPQPGDRHQQRRQGHQRGRPPTLPPRRVTSSGPRRRRPWPAMELPPAPPRPPRPGRHRPPRCRGGRIAPAAASRPASSGAQADRRQALRQSGAARRAVLAPQLPSEPSNAP